MSAALVDHAARSELRRLSALSRVSRGRGNEARRQGEVRRLLPPDPEPVIARADPRGCRWPMWPHEARPSWRDQRFCGEPQRAGCPYCDAHHHTATTEPEVTE